MWTLGVFLLAIATCCHGLYSSSDDVVELTGSNFHDTVVNSDELWLVEFYAPWCGHCQRLVPEWKKAASNLKGIVNVGALDADQHKSVGGSYGIRGFPTIKIFGFDKTSPKDYNGGRDGESITDAAMKALREMVQERKSGGKKKSSGGSGDSRGSGGGGGSDDVVTLTDSNFRELVLNSQETWLVEFYAPWCGHCKNLAPKWASAATEIKDKTGGSIKLGALDATVHQQTAQQYGIRGYPSIKIFRQGHKNEDPIDYDGPRDTSGIVDRAMEYYDENIEPPTVDELVDQSVFDEKCTGHMCIISFLPDLMDSGKDGRNAYLELLAKLGDNFKKQKWGWGWAPALVQDKLEKALGVGGFGYPAMVAINTRKGVYALHRGAFSVEGLNPFLNLLTYGRSSGNTYPIRDGKLPEVEKQEPWDGEEAPPIEEEDIDLSDFKWDDEL
ncbi:protein disulfide-isomerase A6-like [Clavelina lepadiformis]|uniref:protein disulfide-isomerase A6-like n=1 Tax=Clavelina lepadiformis TaxID=159417 RepID=UPI004042D46B